MMSSCLVTFLLLAVVCSTESSGTEVLKVYNIFENRPLGFYVGNIANDTNILQNVSQEIRASVRYSFATEEYSPYFLLDEITGDLNTSDVKVDRDVICEFTDVCSMKLEFYVRGTTYLGVPVVQVNILDENDNAPTFVISTPNPLLISEEESVGSTFLIGEVYDADLPGNNSIQDFRIDQDEGKFDLKIEKNHDTFTFGITLVGALDREQKDEYHLTVIAVDGGKPALTGTHEIMVRVEDANDNSPIFEQAKYNVTVDENISPNTVILTVLANDADVGKNAEIRYRIRERQPNVDTIKRLFAVDERSGEISVTSDLRHEPLETYEFYLEASDNGSLPKTNSTVVQVSVNDVENNAPTIQINLLSHTSGGNTVYIEENQPVDYVVAHVYVEDNDKGDNGKFTCNSTNSLFVLETIHGRGFKIVVGGVLDREEISSHDVTVTCHDHGVDSKEASKEFFVKVTDVNDNDPVFDKIQYTALIRENNSIGEVITRVNAKDVDFGANGTVEYMLGTPDERFVIDNTTGVIFANRSLDREEHDSIIFPVLAVDHGPHRRTASVTVSLTLIDINDNAPVIVPTRPQFWISENRPSNVTVGVLQAVDLDINDGQFHFTIAPLSDKLPFEITLDGEIRTTETLDRELHNRYDIPVTVSDSELSNTQHVTIFVLDENDNSPKITFPNDDNDTVTFEYRADLYNVVTTVAAHDIDYGVNGSLNFSIIGGNEQGIFEIDPDLGEVSVIKFLTIENDLSFTLDITVKDKGRIPRSSLCKLRVILTVPSSANAERIVDNQSNQYVMISVVVIVTTVAVAMAIIGVIVFLRRLDSQKRDEDARYSDSGTSSTSDSQTNEGDFPDGIKKKKEVSFSLDYNLAGLDGGRNVETNTDEFNQRFYDAAPNAVSHAPPTYSTQSQERIDSHMNALKLQQYVLQSKHLDSYKVKLLPPGDSESETSRETNTCDSGRGGSVEDVSTSSPVNDEKCFFGTLQEPRAPKKVSFGSHYYNHPQFPQTPCTSHAQSPVRESTPIHSSHVPPRPLSYKASNSSHNAQITQNQQRLSIKTFANPAQYEHSSKINNLNLPNIHPRDSSRYPEPWRDIYYKNGGIPLRTRHDSGSSFKSNDDDGGSTTTSGSYTLEQADMSRADYYPNKIDILV